LKIEGFVGFYNSISNTPGSGFFSIMDRKIIFLVLSIMLQAQSLLSQRALLDIAIWENKKESVSLERVLENDIQRLLDQSPLVQLNMGFNNNEHWLRLVAQEVDQGPHVLNIAHPSLSTVRLYQKIDNKDWLKRVTGQLVPIEDREMNDSDLAFVLDALNSSDTLYLQIQTSGSLSLPISVDKLPDYIQRKANYSILIGMFIGLMLIMSIYNFILYVNLGDRAYLLYVGATFFGLCTSFVLNGLGYQYFWPDDPERDGHIFLTFAGLSMICSSRFAAEYLKVKLNMPKANWVLWGVAFFSLVLVTLSLYLPASTLVVFGRFLVLLSFPCYIVIAIIAYLKGFKPALYYIVAWIPYIIGLLAVVLRGAGLVPENLFTAYGIEIGGASEAVLLSLALASRIKGMRIELAGKELEQEQFKTRLLEEQKEVLEKEVQKRTLELTRANAVKDKFFSIIGHDLRSPMVALKGMGEKFDFFVRKGKTEKIKGLGAQVDASINNLNHLLNNLLSWAVTESEGMPINPKTFSSKKLVDETIKLHSGLANSLDIIIDVQVDEKQLYADYNAASTVFRNLVSNALKFSESGNKVKIFTEIIEQKFLSFNVQDHGKGMSDEQIENFFTKGKSQDGLRGEKGFGIGLKLAQEFAVLNGGSLSVKSAIGSGSTFGLTIPLAKHNNE
jgi:signal transduction histidine kinase